MENFSKYIKIHQLGKLENKDIFVDENDLIFIQEKMDGANFRFTILNSKLIFGSRTQQITSDEGELTNVAKGFTRSLEYIRDKLQGKDLTKYNGYIFYGEAMHKHTMEYDWKNIPPFLGFDILVNDEFIFYEEAKNIFEELDLPMVPFLGIRFTQTITSITDDMVPISKYAPLSKPEQKAEGIVFKNYNKQIFAKYVRAEFKEDNGKVFGGSPKFQTEYTAKVVAKYCTNARIEKAIWKFIDLGKPLEMSLMPMIVGFVYKDIWEENWKDIIKHKETLELRQMQSDVTMRCKNVLNQVITNNNILKEVKENE